MPHDWALTHADRLYWPDDGVTKEGLADYYAEIWSRMAPLIVERPLALLRCPDGINGQKFFQKHAWKGLSEHIALARDPKEPGEPLIAIHDLDGMIGLVQAATLEVHPWGSTLADWERPDMIVMDLDPGEDVGWEAVIEAAKDVRARLADQGLAAFVKTSGGKGLHVVSPVAPSADWPAVKAFTKAIADAMASDSPDHYVSTIAKAKRGGKIFVDYLRNQRGTTAVAAYSTPGSAGGAGLHAARLGGTGSGNRPGVLHGRQRARRSRVAPAGPMGRLPRRRGADRGAEAPQGGGRLRFSASAGTSAAASWSAPPPRCCGAGRP